MIGGGRIEDGKWVDWWSRSVSDWSELVGGGRMKVGKWVDGWKM